jgi:hypothetical protein
MTWSFIIRLCYAMICIVSRVYRVLASTRLACSVRFDRSPSVQLSSSYLSELLLWLLVLMSMQGVSGGYSTELLTHQHKLKSEHRACTSTQLLSIIQAEHLSLRHFYPRKVVQWHQILLAHPSEAEESCRRPIVT